MPNQTPTDVAADDDRFTFLEGDPRTASPMPGTTRVSLRGFITVRPTITQNSPEYIEETVKTRVANGDFVIDSIFQEDSVIECDHELAHTLAQSDAEEGRGITVEGWKIGDADTATVSDVQIDVAAFADLPTRAIVNDPPYDEQATEIAADSLLSPREAEFSILRNRELNHRQAAAVMGVTKGTTDKLSQRLQEKKGRALHQMQEAQTTTHHFDDVPGWVPDSLETTAELQAASDDQLTFETTTATSDTVFVTYRGWEWAFAADVTRKSDETPYDAALTDIEWPIDASTVSIDLTTLTVTGTAPDEASIERTYALRDVHPSDPDVRDAWRNAIDS